MSLQQAETFELIRKTLNEVRLPTTHRIVVIQYSTICADYNIARMDGAMSRIRKLLKEFPSIIIDTVYGGGYMLTEKI